MDNLPYKDESLDIDERVTDLLNRMSLQEKVAQLGSCYGPILLGKQGPDPEKMTIHIGHGIGHISRIGGFMNLPPETIASLVNGIQKFLVHQNSPGDSSDLP